MVCCGAESRTGLCGSKIGALIFQSLIDPSYFMRELRLGMAIVSLSRMHNAIVESA
jgi:hypothetical protein